MTRTRRPRPSRSFYPSLDTLTDRIAPSAMMAPPDSGMYLTPDPSTTPAAAPDTSINPMLMTPPAY